MTALLDTFASFSVEQWVTYIVCLLACLAPLLQLRIIWQTKSAEGLSLGLFLIFLAVSVVLFRNGLIHDDASLYLAEAIGIITNASVLTLIIYCNARAKGEEAAKLASVIPMEGANNV